ncbi:MAG TPA: hypothetical protein VEJ38_05635 [Candidatus Acidoferrales bacterium]|nr:hypothetical protein [Candidatus Acidoferrales bacterium]
MATHAYESDAARGTKEADYAALAAEHVPPCISIYLSYVSGAESAKQQRMRIRNLLQGAAPALKNFSVSVEEAETLATANWSAVEQSQPPHGEARGLAVFAGKGFFGFSHLTEPVAERVAVGNEFLVRPLLPIIPQRDRFYILALSQKHAKLYEGSRRGIQERTLWDTPESLREDFEGYSFSFERQYQMHTAASPESLQKGAVFHGRSLRHKDRIAHYFHDVDKGVVSALKDQEGPLILAAVDYFVPIYKTENKYPHLLDHAIVGSPDRLTPKELYAAGWKIFEEELANAADRAFAVYTQHANTPLTSSNLRETLSAAQRGLIRFLFIPPAGEQWGSLVAPQTVHLHSAQEAGDAELLNLAAILTLRHGGHVYVVPQSQLREGADIAAVFRYPLGSQVAGAD